MDAISSIGERSIRLAVVLSWFFFAGLVGWSLVSGGTINILSLYLVLCTFGLVAACYAVLRWKRWQVVAVFAACAYAVTKIVLIGYSSFRLGDASGVGIVEGFKLYADRGWSVWILRVSRFGLWNAVIAAYVDVLMLLIQMGIACVLWTRYRKRRHSAVR